MRNLDENTITQAVLARLEHATDERLKDIVTSLVRHLHAFAREVNLTEAEWEQGIQFLTGVGHFTDDKRQEFILLSDTLGLSTLVTAMANRKPLGCTEATVFGPFFVEGAPEYQNGDDVANGARGEPCFVSGFIRGLGGEPVAGARIEVWQADADGFYDVQHAGDDAHRARGVLHSLANGRYHFRSIVAEPYPIPHDGPVGRMLDALGRHPWRPAHLHFMITAPGYERLVTHVFRDGDKYLDSDAVFGVRSSLVAQWIPHEEGVAPDGTRMNTPFSTLEFDFILNRSS
ncbi:Catechol 1,2-dioxygenase [Caballeronia glathei]|jgi:hydroxyquinol 1,2-dioxygenase|uniref:Hydroxyquinol 1,2-dioxygenase n=1 Tax=Caballeronia glathei TaxID=60547 RepID=A0A069PSZ6_9BURK|nr:MULTISPECIES: intradiol ring-cleavage dioxygenase [Burkholderiaceae]KDR43695.1 hydroxyquinol 1,2-dioxygenase [Caballeronia glathei]TCK43650.1 hydroxyquinol 1,2-dioxygenase [Paraburkholderia sp. BL8N3]CDY75694.1 Catechol 1,2-dioxygenase [Caballeronia glathei]